MTAPNYRAALEELADATEGAIYEWGNTVCQHECTHRGGAIWTICDDCDAKWADDEGGFKPFEEPARITKAAAALGRARAVLADPGAGGEGAGWAIEFMGDLLPELHLTKQSADAALATRNARYGDGEHRRVVALVRATHPASGDADGTMGGDS